MLALGTSPAFANSPRDAFRVGLTPVFLDDQAGFIGRWHAYLEKQLDRPVEYFQRGTYREIVDLLRQNKLDAAWVCGYPYVRNRAFLKLLAVPLFEGRPYYRSYLIVPSTDRSTRSILDLRGRVFAFSDPDSNSGYLYPNYQLTTLHERPDAFFGKTFFTWTHSKVVEAVAKQVANGGAVDGYVWETLSRVHPALTSLTRVVAKSPEFGFPPFVTRANLPLESFLAMRQALIGMAEQPDGRTLLKELNLDGFVTGEDKMFDGIEHMARTLSEYRNGSAA